MITLSVQKWPVAMWKREAEEKEWLRKFWAIMFKDVA
jgi:hypothetical protein